MVCVLPMPAPLPPACLALQVTILKVEAGSSVVFIRVGFGGTVSNSAANFQTFLASNPTTAFDVLESTYGPVSVSDITLTFPPPGLPDLAIDLTYYLAPLHFFPAGCGIGKEKGGGGGVTLQVASNCHWGYHIAIGVIISPLVLSYRHPSHHTATPFPRSQAAHSCSAPSRSSRSTASAAWFRTCFHF